MLQNREVEKYNISYRFRFTGFCLFFIYNNFNFQRGMYTNNSFSRGNKCKIFNRYLPNEMSVLGECTGKVFCGIFSKDGNCFITASQGE